MGRPFASTGDTAEQRATLEELADGVVAFTAEGDPNVGAIVGPDGVVAVDARATPIAARAWLEVLRGLTRAPVEHLVLTHGHAVRVLGASAFAARHVVAHERTRRWIAERGAQDWESELRRFPRLFRNPASVPGLTRPDVAFADELVLLLGDREVRLRWLGPGHTPGDAVVWLPAERVLFAGDLVEAGAAPYAGDASIAAWSTGTLDALLALEPEVLVPGRGPAVRGDGVREAVEGTRAFLRVLAGAVGEVQGTGGSLRDAAVAARAALEPDFGGWFLFEHCLPFDVARAFDEAAGLDPRPWTAERDAQVWAELQG
ncbi:MAG: MBL fold metallo-hydrolase [Actinomycetota bacterium]|nr:MBL fold metallo-hydrolase [Actinomycetota bacterium]